MSKQPHGFTLIELIVTLAIFAVALGIAVPNIISWLPNYRLQQAANDLYGHMQQARLAAIRQNQNCVMTFSSGPDRYSIDLLNKTVTLGEYGSGVHYGRSGEGLSFPSNGIITFLPRGIVQVGAGYVYLTNEGGSAYYRVGPLTSGVIRKEKLG